MRTLLEKHIAGTLDEPLRKIVLQKEGNPNYEWSGKLRSIPNKHTSLEIRTDGRFKSLFLNSEAGTIVPDEEYFSLSAQTDDGHRLNLQRLYLTDSPKENPLTGIEATFQPNEITIESDASSKDIHTSAQVGYIRGFRDSDACCLSSRLGQETPLGSDAAQKRWFILRHADTTFALGKEQCGVRELGVWSECNTPENLARAARTFLYALSLYVGERLEWLGYLERNKAATKCVLRQPVPERGELLHQIRPNSISDKDERDFLVRAFDYFVQPTNLRIVKLLAMLWDSRDNFFPIQALVGTTVVEGIANHIVGDQLPANVKQLVRQLKTNASAKIEECWSQISKDLDPKFSDSFKETILKAIGGAGGLPAKELVKRAARSGAVISDYELKRWETLRNPRAHGRFGSNKPDLAEVQTDSTGLDCAFNLTYKLILGAIGYRGQAMDFSKHGWPVRDGSRSFPDD